MKNNGKDLLYPILVIQYEHTYCTEADNIVVQGRLKEVVSNGKIYITA